MNYTYQEIAGMIDHSLLHPTMTDRELVEGCELAVKYQVASVCIKPYAVKKAAELLKGSRVRVGTVVGFPHGSNTTEVKRYETEMACKDGAKEIDMVNNPGKALSKDWDYVEKEIAAIVSEASRHGAIVKVIFENDYFSEDELKKRLCQVSETAGAAFVKTSTGYGYVKQKDGAFLTKGATEPDIRLMRKTCSAKVEVKAAGGVRDLDALIKMKLLGATRVGASATQSILEEYNKRSGKTPVSTASSAPTSGY